MTCLLIFLCLMLAAIFSAEKSENGPWPTWMLFVLAALLIAAITIIVVWTK
jgi:hypothetical protein